MNTTKFSIVALSVMFCFGVTGQNLPLEMQYNPDGKILYTGGKLVPTGLYDPNVIDTLFLDFPQANYWTQLTNNYASETLIPAKLTYRGQVLDSVGVRFRGNTSYTGVAQSQKKSFAIETDFVRPGQHLLGYRNLKLNNGHQDASFMREVLFGRMAARHTPIAKTGYVRLFINQQDWGLYPNIQTVDKTFLEEWFPSNDGARFRAISATGGNPGPWGDGTAAVNFLGNDTLTYQNYYSLKSNDVVVSPWEKLVDACRALQSLDTNNLDSVAKFLDFDRILWHLAIENIFTDDDSYVMKGKMDYLLYIMPETGQMFSMEYDGNSSFQSQQATSTNWGPFKNVGNANYPLLNKLLAIPELRQRYLAHYRTILQETFTTAQATSLVNGLQSQIGAHVASDTKKLYTTNQYNTSSQGLISFVTNRRNFLMNQTEVAQVGPVISGVVMQDAQGGSITQPLPYQPVQLMAKVQHNTGIHKVWLYVTEGIDQMYQRVAMWDDGLHGDSLAGDGWYGATLPGKKAHTLVRFYVEAQANNTPKSASFLPTGASHDAFAYTVVAPFSPNGVVINEFMASNQQTVGDEAQEFDDWIEIYNNNQVTMDLSGYVLTDKVDKAYKWVFPQGTLLPANGYLVVWADEQGSQGTYHCNFKLSSAGEMLMLSDSTGTILDSVYFGLQTTDVALARVPNGTGGWTPQTATFMANNQPMAILPEENVTQWAIYPNPTHHSFRVIGMTEEQPYVLMDMQGRTLQQGWLSAGTEVNVADVPSGIYFLLVSDAPKPLKVVKYE